MQIRPGRYNGSQLDRRRLHGQVRPRAERGGGVFRSWHGSSSGPERTQAGVLEGPGAGRAPVPAQAVPERTQIGGEGGLRVEARQGSWLPAAPVSADSLQRPAGCFLTKREAGPLLAQFQSRWAYSVGIIG